MHSSPSRRAVFVALSTSLLAACSSQHGTDAATSSGSTGGETPDAGPIGGSRPVQLIVPTSYDGKTAVPLVILLHGYGFSGTLEEQYMQIAPVAEQLGFLYAHPDSTVDSSGSQFWNATNACCDLDNVPVDDSAYLSGVIQEVEARYNVDPKRVYFVGHSNGGFMAYRMACDHANQVAAIASLAGAMWSDASECNPSAPVSVLELHGTADMTIDYDGGTIGTATYPGAMTTVLDWVKFDGCGTAADTSAPPFQIDASIAGNATQASKWATGCKDGSGVELWTMTGSGHVPLPLANDFASRVTAWLFAHARP